MAGREYITIYDTTLRDGQQAQGVDFSAAQKQKILDALDALGVDYIEGGWPGANPTDTRFFEATTAPRRARLTAFGMTKRTGRSVANDPTLAAVLAAETATVCLVGKSDPFHVERALGISMAENLMAISESIAHVVGQGREALFDAEHFFDGFRRDPEYATACVEAAVAAGANWVVLCDTNGGTLPNEIGTAVAHVCTQLPHAKVGIHTHNDAELAVANTFAAIDAGARQVQGTINGIGERCGNANLISILPSLVLKEPYRSQYETNVTEESLGNLTAVSRLVDDILNEPPNRRAPYVGNSAFAHKAGLHASAIVKAPETYEHVVPETVGNMRAVTVSRQAGLANIRAALTATGIEVDPTDERLPGLVELVKSLEDEGYAFDAAGASFVLRAREYLGLHKQFFTVERYRVSVERRRDTSGREYTASEAVVVAVVDDKRTISASESIGPAGEPDLGPVNALARALRKDLGSHQATISDMRLVDFRVRILDTGTEAVTRVLIDSADAAGQTWSTVGVSANVVDASFQALLDSINYKLLIDQRI